MSKPSPAPQVQWKYLLSELNLGKEEELAAIEVIRSGWLSMGPESQRLEEEFAAYIGARYVLVTSNCTTALHLALLATGIQPGDEVIVPALTFVASTNAILYAGAKPVFADIQALDRPLIDPKEIEAKITPRTRAILVVHYAGYPCDMEAIRALATRHKLKVIEDAAHCSGTSFGDRKCGTLGDVGCFSLFANKNLPAGEGGFLVTDDPEVYAKAKLQRSHGMTTLSWERAKGHAFHYDVVELGFNYRMPELSAAIGRAQLKKLVAHNLERDRVFNRYRHALGMEPELVIPFREDKPPGSRHLMPILLPPTASREKVMEGLRAEGIQSSIHYTPVYSFSLYRKMPEYAQITLARTEEYSRRVITLPFHPHLSDRDVDTIAEAVTRVTRLNLPRVRPAA